MLQSLWALLTIGMFVTIQIRKSSKVIKCFNMELMSSYHNLSSKSLFTGIPLISRVLNEYNNWLDYSKIAERIFKLVGAMAVCQYKWYILSDDNLFYYGRKKNWCIVNL